LEGRAPNRAPYCLDISPSSLHFTPLSENLVFVIYTRQFVGNPGTTRQATFLIWLRSTGPKVVKPYVGIVTDFAKS
jgi:hypothetical protein